MNTTHRLHWAGLTHSGSRKERNDDALLAFASGPDGATPLAHSGSRSLEFHDLVFAVSDGMGGAKAGDLASSLILQKMSEIVPETFKLAAAGFFPDCLSHLSEAIRSVHDHINEAAQASEENKGMAATLALIWFTPDNAYISNVGDSRIYRLRGDSLEQLSRDHTSAWGQWKRGEIGEVQYRAHPRRAALYEVIGGGHQNVCPHLAAIPYEPGDKFLICSDGVIDGLWERHIATGLATHPTPEDTAAALLQRAVNNSGIDDATLFVIGISEI